MFLFCKGVSCVPFLMIKFETLVENIDGFSIGYVHVCVYTYI